MKMFQRLDKRIVVKNAILNGVRIMGSDHVSIAIEFTIPRPPKDKLESLLPNIVAKICDCTLDIPSDENDEDADAVYLFTNNPTPAEPTP